MALLLFVSSFFVVIVLSEKDRQRGTSTFSLYIYWSICFLLSVLVCLTRRL